LYIGANLFAQIPAAVNIKGVFNTSNETKYETEVPEGRYLFPSLSCRFGFAFSLMLTVRQLVWFQEFLLISTSIEHFGVYRLVSGVLFF